MATLEAKIVRHIVDVDSFNYLLPIFQYGTDIDIKGFTIHTNDGIVMQPSFKFKANRISLSDFASNVTGKVVILFDYTKD